STCWTRTLRGELPSRLLLALIDVELAQERKLVVDALQQILVVLDHLAAHVDAKPLLVHEYLIAIQHVSERQGPLCDQAGQVHGGLKPQRDRLKIWGADGRIPDQEHR